MWIADSLRVVPLFPACVCYYCYLCTLEGSQALRSSQLPHLCCVYRRALERHVIQPAPMYFPKPLAIEGKADDVPFSLRTAYQVCSALAPNFEVGFPDDPDGTRYYPHSLVLFFL